MLMYHADAEVERILRRTDDYLFPVDKDLTLIGEIYAGEHIHQRRLAAAVLAEQGEYLSPVDVKPDLVVCNDRAEGLCDVSHFYCGYLVVQRLHAPK